MRRYLLGLLIFMWLSLSACASTANNPAAQGAQASAVYIQNKGSDTMVNLALAWAERYQQIHPEVQISVTGGGSGTGLASLANGTVDLANASRAITADETKQAIQNGNKPYEFTVARDAIAVIVNPNNPIDHLTIQQVSQIYRGDINNWKEVGGEDRPIVRLSRETNSGTHVYFLETVVRLGSKTDKTIFTANTLLLPSSEGIISEVKDNPNAIGYDGLGYITKEVKVLGIAKDEKNPPVKPSAATVNDKSYAISRDLYIYSRNEPSTAIKAYLDWILSPEAQDIVTQLGFVPIKH